MAKDAPPQARLFLYCPGGWTITPNHRHGKHSGGKKHPAATLFSGQQQLDTLLVSQARKY
jgi:hypothetical protein